MENKIGSKMFEIQKLNLKYHKGKVNPFFKSKYLDLDSLLEQLLPEANKRSLLITHQVVDGKLGTVVMDVEDGSSLMSQFPLPVGVDPQKIGSAISYAKRYNLSSLFNIVSDEDNDGNQEVAPVNNNDIII